MASCRFLFFVLTGRRKLTSLRPLLFGRLKKNWHGVQRYEKIGLSGVVLTRAAMGQALKIAGGTPAPLKKSVLAYE
jgi:hypothetical protein